MSQKSIAIWRLKIILLLHSRNYYGITFWGVGVKLQSMSVQLLIFIEKCIKIIAKTRYLNYFHDLLVNIKNVIPLINVHL